jgi:hypothetical protein
LPPQGEPEDEKEELRLRIMASLDEESPFNLDVDRASPNLQLFLRNRGLQSMMPERYHGAELGSLYRRQPSSP